MARGRDQEYYASGAPGERVLSDARFSPLETADSDITGARRKVETELRKWYGPDALEWVGKQPDELEDPGELYRFQVAQIYLYGIGLDEDGSPKEGRIEVKAHVNTVGVPREDLADRLRLDLDRVTTAFNSGPYEGYLQGFSPYDKEISKEGPPEQIARDDANNLGVPQFRVEIYDESNALSGVAAGFLDPFDVRTRTVRTGDQPPQNETWNIRKQSARGSYEFTTKADARDRARQVASRRRKDIYINGVRTGKQLRPARGTFEIKDDYQRKPSPDIRDRGEILERSGANPQAFADGTNAYKVGETEGEIFFVLTKPDDFQPADPDDIDPEDIGEKERVEIDIREKDGYTEVDIRRDERLIRHLGLYTPPLTREIERRTELSLS